MVFKNVLLCNPEKIFFRSVSASVREVPHNVDFGFKLRWKFTFSQHLRYLLGWRLDGPEGHSVCGCEEKIPPLAGTELKSDGEGHKVF